MYLAVVPLVVIAFAFGLIVGARVMGYLFHRGLHEVEICGPCLKKIEAKCKT